MNRLYKYIGLAISAMGSFMADAQQTGFRDPLNIPIQLAANFGEIRTNHYHMGLDIRTQQRENLPVFAVADGYISRVYISPYGYGNMLMVTHPNGYTTLYAHLNKFEEPLASFVKEKQYKDQSWLQNFSLPEGQFPVKKGQQIALSGNTGGSEGPHVHFEIRNSLTDKQQNPLLMGMYVPDAIQPTISQLYWYDRRYSTYETNPEPIAIEKVGNEYRTRSGIVKIQSPIFSFGIRAQDKTSNSPFNFGIYKASVLLDNKPVFTFALNNFNNEDSRYINAGIDYRQKMTQGRNIQHLSILPGNKLNIFTDGNGILMLNDTLPHDVKIVVSDPAGNQSALTTKVQLASSFLPAPETESYTAMVQPNQPGNIRSAHAQFIYSENAFYDNVPFLMKETAATSGNQASPTIRLAQSNIPVHDFYTIGIEYDLSKGEGNKKYTVVALKSGSSTNYTKGKWSGNMLLGKFNKLGNAYLLIDSIAPRIIPVGWANGTRIPASKSTLAFRTADNVGTDDEVTATLDGQWLLFVQRGSTYTYTFDGHFPKGQHELKIVVKDIAGNKTEQTYQLTKD